MRSGPQIVSLAPSVSKVTMGNNAVKPGQFHVLALPSTNNTRSVSLKSSTSIQKLISKKLVCFLTPGPGPQKEGGVAGISEAL